jgi:chaperonin GroES
VPNRPKETLTLLAHVDTMESSAGLTGRRVFSNFLLVSFETLPIQHCLGRRLRRKSVNLRPLQDRIIVQRVSAAEQRAGSIIIPDSAKEKPQQAKVIAVGNGRRQENGKVIALDVKSGDTILIGKYSGHDVSIDGEDYVILREDEVLAVIE